MWLLALTLHPCRMPHLAHPRAGILETIINGHGIDTDASTAAAAVSLPGGADASLSSSTAALASEEGLPSSQPGTDAVASLRPPQQQPLASSSSMLRCRSSSGSLASASASAPSSSLGPLQAALAVGLGTDAAAELLQAIIKANGG